VERSFNAGCWQAGTNGALRRCRRKTFARWNKSRAGENVVSDCRRKIQYIADRELEQAMQDTHASRAGIVQNRVRARFWRSRQSEFHPNARNEIRPRSSRTTRQRCLRARMTSRSTIAAGLEKGNDPRNRLIADGSIVVAGMRIRDSKPHGILSVADVLATPATWGRSRLFASRRRPFL